MNKYRDILKNAKRIHMVGIGGSGMSPLADILLTDGYELSGSDNNPSDTLSRIENAGAKIHMGHNGSNIEGADLVVYSAAISQENPELVAAKEKGIPAIERSVLLGLVSENYNDAICVSGTHGKTTTTSLIAQTLLMAKKDPTVVIGGKLPYMGSNGRAGKSDIMVCEACEYVDTFLKLAPDISIILNIDSDHLDYFKTMDNMKKSFEKFGDMATKCLIYNGDDQNTVEVANRLHKEKISFGKDKSNDYYYDNVVNHEGLSFRFDVFKKGEKIANVTLHRPGKHNIMNSLAAFVACDYVGVPVEDIVKGIGGYKGTDRRFQLYGKFNGFTLVDDYAHHPTEIFATVAAAKELDFKRVWVVFQPFTFSRTAQWKKEFEESLGTADKVIITPIMGSREQNTFNISSEDLVANMTNAVCIHEFEDVADYLIKNAGEGDLVITMGGGDIYKVAHLIEKKCK